MQTILSYRSHAVAVLALGLPLAGSHLAGFAIGVIDVIMLGRYGVQELAAVVLGSSFFVTFLLFGSGFGQAVMPMVARAQSSGDVTQIRRVTRMALWWSVLFGLAVMPIFLFSGPLLRLAGQDPEIARLAGLYLQIVSLQMFPALGMWVLRAYLAAMDRSRAVFLFTIAAVALNAALNYLLIFGAFGFPELGLAGAAIASVIVNTLGFVLHAVYAVRTFPEHSLFQRFLKPDPEAFTRVFRIGWPIGVTLLAEIALFSAAALLIGAIGTIELAAHGVALQIASATFLVHLGLANAATIRAGQALGREDGAGLLRGALVASVLSMAFVGVAVVLFLAVPEWLMGLFLDPSDPATPAVIAVGVSLLAIAALFQLADAGQVMAVGLLRGLEDTRVPMIYAAISYWLVGGPAAYLLAFPVGWGPQGVWLGLTFGLSVAWVLLGGRFWFNKGRLDHAA